MISMLSVVDEMSNGPLIGPLDISVTQSLPESIREKFRLGRICTSFILGWQAYVERGNVRLRRVHKTKHPLCPIKQLIFHPNTVSCSSNVFRLITESPILIILVAS